MFNKMFEKIAFNMGAAASFWDDFSVDDRTTTYSFNPSTMKIQRVKMSKYAADEAAAKEMIVYHASPVQDIKKFKHFDDVMWNKGKVIFGSISPEYAAPFGCRWNDSNGGFKIETSDGKPPTNHNFKGIILKVTDEVDIDKPCSMYKLKGNFEDLRYPDDIEKFTKGDVEILSETKYNSYRDMAKEYGVEIRHVGDRYIEKKLSAQKNPEKMGAVAMSAFDAMFEKIAEEKDEELELWESRNFRDDRGTVQDMIEESVANIGEENRGKVRQFLKSQYDTYGEVGMKAPFQSLEELDGMLSKLTSMTPEQKAKAKEDFMNIQVMYPHPIFGTMVTQPRKVYNRYWYDNDPNALFEGIFKSVPNINRKKFLGIPVGPKELSRGSKGFEESEKAYVNNIKKKFMDKPAAVFGRDGIVMLNKDTLKYASAFDTMFEKTADDFKYEAPANKEVPYGLIAGLVAGGAVGSVAAAKNLSWELPRYVANKAGFGLPIARAAGGAALAAGAGAGAGAIIDKVTDNNEKECVKNVS